MSGKFALIMGNAQYTDPGLAQLSAPGQDARDFGAVLKDPNLCGFDDVKVVLDQLSYSAIEAIDDFFDERRPDDLLVLYFSGHGVRDEFGSLYLAFKNTIRSRLRSSAVKAEYIREAMDQSRSKRQVLILDCCNSGAFPQGTKAELGGTMGMVTAFQGYGRYVLTASDATQFAWQGDTVIGKTENSLFTHFLVRGLQGEADDDGDGRITVDELYDYAFDQISKVTPKQTPTKSASRQEGEIILRQITRMEDIRAASLPEELSEAISDSRMFIREAATQQLEALLKGSKLGLARSAKETLERMAAQDDSLRVRQAAARVLESVGPMAETGGSARREPEAKEAVQAAPVQAVEDESLQRAGLDRAAAPLRAQHAVGPESSERGLRPRWAAVIWIALGWAIGLLLAVVFSTTSTFSLSSLLMLFATGGVLNAIVFRVEGVLASWRSQLWVALGWTGGFGMGFLIGAGIMGWLSPTVGGAGFDAGPIVIVSGALGGGLGAFLNTITLRSNNVDVGRKRATAITLAWAAAVCIGLISLYVELTLGIPTGYSQTGQLIGAALSGLLTGSIGGAVMIWQLRQPRT